MDEIQPSTNSVSDNADGQLNENNPDQVSPRLKPSDTQDSAPTVARIEPLKEMMPQYMKNNDQRI